jgi:2-polyprenyl-3-methyl-5-hydroxy-6-metoxy-1,4-benzoquinol methylase
MTKRDSKYKDFIIKNERFVGKFEEMYQKISDPWKLLKKNKSGLNLNYKVILNYCEQIRFSKTKTLEIGCGYPQISYELYKKKFVVHGTDISKTVIEKSKKKYPELKNNLYVSNFLNFSLYQKIKPDIVILSDITWYVLPELRRFIRWFKNLKSKTYLIHSLTLYKKNVQKYGKKYFYDLDTIKSFFKLNYLSSGYIEDIDDVKHAFFLSSNK